MANVQVDHFLTNLTVPTAIGPITLPRGWASVDVHSRCRSFRFVTTHLDIVPSIALAQASELVASAANTNLPLVLSGDFNSNAANPADPSYPAYRAIIDAGFADAWLQKHHPDSGFTCCQAPDLLNAASSLNQRIDLVLLRGRVDAPRIELIGNRQKDRTSSGLWPSDHAGVAATLPLDR